MPPMKSESGF